MTMPSVNCRLRRDPSGLRRFKGVRKRQWGRWVSEIRIPRSRDKIWLGSFSTPEEAARAYDTAYLLLRSPNSSSCLNFSDSLLLITPHLAEYTSGHVTNRTIQAAAAAIASTVTAEAHLSASRQTANGGDESAQQPNQMSTLNEDTSSEEDGACLEGFDSVEYRWFTDLLSLIGSPSREKAGSPSSLFSVRAESPSVFSAAAESSQLHQGKRSSSCSNADQQLGAGSGNAASHDPQRYVVQEGLQGVRSSSCSSCVDQTHVVTGSCNLAANDNRKQGLRAGASSSCSSCACACLEYHQLEVGSCNGGAVGDDRSEQASQELGLQGVPDLHGLCDLEDEQLINASCFVIHCEEAYLQEGLLKDGFTAMSPAVTTRERLDADVTWDIHSLSAPLWIYPC